MKRLAVLPLLLLIASPAAAGVRTYEVRLTPGANGAGRAVATVSLDAAVPGVATVPVGFARISQLHLETAPQGTSLASEARNGQTLVHVALPAGTAAQAVVSFGFTVAGAFVAPVPAAGEKATLPAGSLLLRHALLNSQPDPIGCYRFEVVFPDGVRAHAVREALPKLRKTESVPRVQLEAIDGRPGARLQVDGLNQGATASMQIELVPASRSIGWLVAGLVLSVLYLVYFRDLVSRRAP